MNLLCHQCLLYIVYIRLYYNLLYYHNLRTRRNGHSAIIDVNIHVNPRMSVAEGHAIASEVENNIRQLISGDAIIYVHVEPAD